MMIPKANGLKAHHLLLAIAVSLAAHMLVLSGVWSFGSHAFTRPISFEATMMELVDLPPFAAHTAEAARRTSKPATVSPTPSAPDFSSPAGSFPQHYSGQFQPGSEVIVEAPSAPLDNHASDSEPEPIANVASNTVVAERQPSDPVSHAVRTPEDFTIARRETLTYRITMHGMPIGEAVLEAFRQEGEMRIGLRARTNAVTSLFYPVENVTETRMFKGRYFVTTIKQREGDYRSDIGFTISLAEKNVFWVDRLRKVYVNEPMQSDEILDLVSGFYFMRKRSLSVGETVILDIYDSNKFSKTPVHVIRSEKVKLPNRKKEVPALVIHPELSVAGPFRRTGDIRIWLTNDEHHVPLRMETAIPIGPITVELVKAEVEPQDL